MSYLGVGILGVIAGIAMGAFGKWTFKKLKQAVKKAKGLRDEWEG